MNRTAACFAAFAALLLYLTPNTSLAQEKAKKDSSFVFDTIYLERVQVVGRPAWQTTIPGAATYISTEELRKQSYDDINRVLRSVSGINIQEEDGFGLRPNIGIRGAGVERSTKVNLMEDGVLISPAPYSAPAAYYFPMVGRMSAVEVRKGSSQIKYGPNSTGGAINLVSTPIPFEVSANGEVSLGENNANKFHGNVGATFGNFGFLIEGMNISDDGFKRLDNGGDTGFEITDLMAKLMVRTKDNASVYQRLEFKAGYYDEVSDETYLGLTRSDFDQSPFRRYAGSQVDQMTADHTQFMLRHFALFSERFNITTTAYRNDFSRNWYKLESVNSTDISTILRTPEQFTAEMDFLRGTNSPDDALTVRANNRTYFSTGIETILSFNNDWGRFTNDLEFG
ncbi:MAG: TonB-dependent receptor family protein, partial [Balneolaceae bacterium]